MTGHPASGLRRAAEPGAAAVPGETPYARETGHPKNSGEVLPE